MSEIEEFMEDLVSIDKMEDKERDIPPLPPKLFYDADYAIRTWLEHRLHHTYPDVGGYNDQSLELMLDWHKLNVYYLRVYRGEFGSQDIPDDAVPLASIMRD